MSQCPCKVQGSIHKTIWGPKFYTCPSGAQNFTQGLGCQLIFKISKFFYTEFVLNIFSVPRWVFLANGIKMTLKVPGAILARFENLDPLCGPTMENARIFNTHHGSKRPIMDPLNHAHQCIITAVSIFIRYFSSPKNCSSKLDWNCRTKCFSSCISSSKWSIWIRQQINERIILRKFPVKTK